MGTRTLLRTGLAALLLLLVVPTFLAAQERQISGRVTRSGSTAPVPDVEIFNGHGPFGASDDRASDEASPSDGAFERVPASSCRFLEAS